MSDRVGVRDLRQNLSRYLDRVKAGDSLVVTERGREVARLVPSAASVAPALERLLARGATMPGGDLLDATWSRSPPGYPRPSVQEVLDDLREDRV